MAFKPNAPHYIVFDLERLEEEETLPGNEELDLRLAAVRYAFNRQRDLDQLVPIS